MATKLFDYTVLQDRSLISNVRNTLVKLKISFVKKIDKNVGEYENYLASSSKFFQHMVLLAFGVETQEREVCLLYISRIVQFLNSKHNGTKNNFLFIEYNEEKTIQEVEVYGTTVCVITEGVPDHYDRVLIHSSDFPDALLAYYDSHEKLFILDDGKKILPVIGLKWLSISELTNTL